MMINQEQLKEEIRQTIISHVQSTTEFYGVAGAGIVYKWTLDALVPYVQELKEENERLKSLLLLDQEVK